jgi:hypothetical protein
MGKKPMTVIELARMGQRAFAAKYSKRDRQIWGKESGGRPPALDAKAVAGLEKMLSAGKSQRECAELLGVTARTVGRYKWRLTEGRRRKEGTK